MNAVSRRSARATVTELLFYADDCHARVRRHLAGEEPPDLAAQADRIVAVPRPPHLTRGVADLEPIGSGC